MISALSEIGYCDSCCKFIYIASIMMTQEHDNVVMNIDGISFPANLTVPPRSRGVVVFAHGSGSSRFSPRNAYVARVLRDQNIGTLMFDLLTPSEDRDKANRFNTSLLGHRLSMATKWLRNRPEFSDIPIGYFGASTGAAAALVAAQFNDVKAIVSRGGRPDLAFDALNRVTVPTLLIVGGDDSDVIRLNEMAYNALAVAVKRLEIVPGATHLFEEPGCLEQVAALASDWFTRYL